MTTTDRITPQALHDLASRQEVLLLDVRTPAEYEAVHAEGAQNMPLDALDPDKVAALAAGQTVYVICQSGGRSRKAWQALAEKTSVVDVEGGTKAWQQAGLPVVRGRQTISLERQVRIVAGLLVLTGGVLAVTVHPYWALLSAFVGAGLAFAGITDSCAMAMVLAKMPWNQTSSGSPNREQAGKMLRA